MRDVGDDAQDVQDVCVLELERDPPPVVLLLDGGGVERGGVVLVKSPENDVPSYNFV